MANFIQKRLQVFVSSTYTDLIEERQAAVEAILTMGHIPAGMELFTSGDESQLDVIKQWIDESDVYLLILGGRYGSIEKNTGKSYTQIEYEYAVERDKPYFACVIKDDALEGRAKSKGLPILSIVETQNTQKLNEFRELVKSKIVKFWGDEKDIKIIVTESLSHLSRKDDLIGWIRGDQAANTSALADEIARLSKENSELRAQIIKSSNQDESFNGLNFSQIKTILQENGLLDFIKTNRIKLARSLDCKQMIDSGQVKELHELNALGIITFIDYRTVKLTDTGLILLNKLEIEKRKAFL